MIGFVRVSCGCDRPRGVDSSYNVQANMSVRRGVTRGISVHSIYKEKVLFFYSVYIYKGYYEL